MDVFFYLDWVHDPAVTSPYGVVKDEMTGSAVKRNKTPVTAVM